MKMKIDWDSVAVQRVWHAAIAAAGIFMAVAIPQLPNTMPSDPLADMIAGLGWYILTIGVPSLCIAAGMALGVLAATFEGKN